MGIMRKMLSKIKSIFDPSSASEKIISKKVKKYRSALKNENFSILSSNCIAGTIYNRLGKKFLTPTINLYFSEKGFVKFCCNLDYYLSCKLRFIESDLAYPVGELGDGDKAIQLFFNHHNCPEDARKDWDRRKGRINRENLYIIFYNIDVSIDEIRAIEQVPCKNIAVLTSTPLPLKYAYYVKKTKTKPGEEHFMQDHYLDKDKNGIRKFEKYFDFVSWLNTDQNH